MTAFWTEADYDDHELVQLVHDQSSGLTAIIALHSTHLGPGPAARELWHYADPAAAMRDVLRSAADELQERHGGSADGRRQAVILADAKKTKTPAMLAASATRSSAGGSLRNGRGCRHLGSDMVALRRNAIRVRPPVEGEGNAGGIPAPYGDGHLSRHQGCGPPQRGKDSLTGVHVAVQALAASAAA